MKTVLDLSPTKARQYFLESKNYCNMQIPVYIDFTPIIDYVEGVVDKKELKDIQIDPPKWPSDFENINHKILVKKDAKYSYRPIHLITPYLYYLLVKAITNKVYWKEIKDRFTQLTVSNIEVASIPAVKGDSDKSHSSASVSNWWENVEQRSIELGLSYRYMFVTDITNCYGSLYTHTIAWALMGKDIAVAFPKSLQTTLQEPLCDVIDQWNILDTSVKALNHEMVQTLHLIVDFVPLNERKAVEAASPDSEERRRLARGYFKDKD